MTVIIVSIAVTFLFVGVSSLQCWNCDAMCKTREKTENGFSNCLVDSGCNWRNESEKMTCSEGVNHCLKLDNKKDGSMY